MDNDIVRYKGIVPKLIELDYISEDDSQNYNKIKLVVNGIRLTRMINSTRSNYMNYMLAITLVIEKFFIYLPLLGSLAPLFKGMTRLARDIFSDYKDIINDILLDNYLKSRNKVTRIAPKRSLLHSIFDRCLFLIANNVISRLFDLKEEKESVKELFNVIVKMVNGEYDYDISNNEELDEKSLSENDLTTDPAALVSAVSIILSKTAYALSPKVKEI